MIMVCEKIFSEYSNQNNQKREVTGKTLEQLAQETNNIIW